jgi:hypothetical protein
MMVDLWRQALESASMGDLCGTEWLLGSQTLVYWAGTRELEREAKDLADKYSSRRLRLYGDLPDGFSGDATAGDASDLVSVTP